MMVFELPTNDVEGPLWARLDLSPGSRHISEIAVGSGFLSGVSSDAYNMQTGYYLTQYFRLALSKAEIMRV
jgi:hypothetical protein